MHNAQSGCALLMHNAQWVTYGCLRGLDCEDGAVEGIGAGRGEAKGASAQAMVLYDGSIVLWPETLETASLLDGE